MGWRIASLIAALLAGIFGLIWAVLRVEEMRPSAGPSPIPDLSIFGLLLFGLFWLVSLGLAHRRHRDKRRFAWGAGLGVAAVFLIIWLTPAVLNWHFDWQSNRIEKIVAQRIAGMPELPQTVEAFRADDEEFRQEIRRITFRDLNGPAWDARVRYSRFWLLYVAIILGDQDTLERVVPPPMQPECDLFREQFATVYHPNRHAEDYARICGE